MNAVEVIETSSLKSIFFQPIPESMRIVKAALGNKNDLVHVLTSSGWPVEHVLQTFSIASKQQVYSFKIAFEFPLLAVSSTGRQLAIANMGSKEARIYNALSGEVTQTLQSISEPIVQIAFSSNEKLLAIASGKKVNVYDATSGKQKASVGNQAGQFTAIAFSNKSSQLATVGTDKTAKIWNAESGKLMKEFKHDEEVYRVAFTSQDNYLLTGFEYFGLIVWDINKGTQHRNLYTGMAKLLNGKQATPDEKLIFASMYGGAKIHKTANGEPVHEFLNYTAEIDHIRMSHDKKKLLSLNGQNGIDIWNLQNGQFIAGLGLPDTMRYITIISDAIFSADNTSIIAGLHNGSLVRWELPSGRYLGVYTTTENGAVRELRFNSKKDALLVTGTKGVSYYALPSLRRQVRFTGTDKEILTTTFSPDETQVVVNTFGDKAYVLAAEDGSLQYSIEKNSYAGTPLFSPDGKVLNIVTSNAYAVQYDALTGKEINKFKTWPREFNPQGANLSPDGKFFYIPIGVDVIKETHAVEIHDAGTGALAKALPGVFFSKIAFLKNAECVLVNNSIIEKRRLPGMELIQQTKGTDFVLDEDNNRLFVKNQYHTEVLRLNDFLKQVSYIGIGSAESQKFRSMGGITLLPNGYYMGSKEAVATLHYLKGLQPVAFDQLDILYNRPDKVQQALGADAVSIEAFRTAYSKRLKKLNIDSAALTEKYSVPQADIANRDEIKAEQEKANLQLQLTAFDAASMLHSYNVWVNGVPVYGMAGVDLKSKKTQRLDTKVNITLSKGSNKIEMAVTNANGIESYRLPLYVYQGSKEEADKFGGYQSYDPNKPIEEFVYFAGIGINKFAEPGNNLTWSVKDIRDLCLKLKEKYGEALIIDTLFDEMVTVNDIRNLKTRLVKSGVNDKVIVAYSGHGLLSKDFDYYLSTYDVAFSNPEKGGLPYEALENLLDGIPARKKLMLIDACHSGEVDKETLQQLKASAQADTSITQGAKGVEPLIKADTKMLGMKNSFELMQELFVQVGKSTGASIISAAAGTQFALERNDLKNGVFTYSILNAMQNEDHMKLSVLKKLVADKVVALTKGLQKPTSRNETPVVDWDVW
ncbi:MAG: hypothetical protein EOO03_05955 [Chitinophagaceae bacterium]|nr:MAG: hypothetical protein EOO03_05955 [Chitinophagaceae bacterium]